MEPIQYNAVPHDEYTDGLIYDGHEADVNRIEEYRDDEYNFYPDAAF